MHSEVYSAMPIFSRRYASAFGKVTKHLAFRSARLRLPELRRSKPQIFGHYRTRWYSFWDIAFRKQAWPPWKSDVQVTLFMPTNSNHTNHPVTAISRALRDRQLLSGLHRKHEFLIHEGQHLSWHLWSIAWQLAWLVQRFIKSITPFCHCEEP